tara:strand:+ start:8184 stop:8405 length:222 start_codon:yes stop_codon:yes gene_type:complete
MFSEQLNKQIENLGIKTDGGSTQVRHLLEDALDEAAQFINTEHHNKYQAAEEAYSNFMEELNNMLDASDALFN